MLKTREEVDKDIDQLKIICKDQAILIEHMITAIKSMEALLTLNSRRIELLENKKSSTKSPYVPRKLSHK